MLFLRRRPDSKAQPQPTSHPGPCAPPRNPPVTPEAARSYLSHRVQSPAKATGPRRRLQTASVLSLDTAARPFSRHTLPAAISPYTHRITEESPGCSSLRGTRDPMPWTGPTTKQGRGTAPPYCSCTGFPTTSPVTRTWLRWPNRAFGSAPPICGGTVPQRFSSWTPWAWRRPMWPDTTGDRNSPKWHFSDERTSSAHHFIGPRPHGQVKDAGHNLPQERPDAFAGAVRAVRLLRHEYAARY